MQADCRETVIRLLKNRGYYLISVDREDRLSGFLRSGLSFGNPVNIRDRALFTHQLATLLRAGMQLSLALDTLSKQTQNKYLASVIGQLNRDVEESSSLSQAMAKHARVFPRLYTAIVKAAEESARFNDGAKTLRHLSQSGAHSLEVAETTISSLATDVLRFVRSL